MSKSPKIKRSFITESELEKYLTNLEVGTQEEAAKKLGLPYPSAISNAITSIDAKLQASVQTVKVALKYEMFRRLGKDYQELSRRFSYVFDEEQEVLQLSKAITHEVRELIEWSTQ